MEKITNLITKIKYFINYLYYYKSSITKNVYPCKLIGEKINPQGNATIILYKLSGQQDIKEIPLHDLLDNKKLIERFHPADGVKLGSISFKDIILVLDKDKQEEKFHQIKNIMLNSTHDICPGNKLIESKQLYELPSNKSDHENDYIDSVVRTNAYPCKLAAAKPTHKKNCTIIIFTILGKRDGHEKLLSELLTENELLEKFHPTEAIKFGFISLGDLIFESSISKI